MYAKIMEEFRSCVVHLVGSKAGEEQDECVGLASTDRAAGR